MTALQRSPCAKRRMIAVSDRRSQIKAEEIADILYSAGITADRFRGVFSWHLYMHNVLLELEKLEGSP